MINKIEINTINSQECSNSINDINEKKKKYTLKAKITIKFDLLSKKFNSNMTVFDLKNYVNIKFHIQEFEYEISIGETPINNVSNDTLIASLINKYNVNNIIVKSYKSILDVNKELTNYENFLSKKISFKEEEIKLLSLENEKLKQDLNNIE